MEQTPSKPRRIPRETPQASSLEEMYLAAEQRGGLMAWGRLEGVRADLRLGAMPPTSTADGDTVAPKRGVGGTGGTLPMRGLGSADTVRS